MADGAVVDTRGISVRERAALRRAVTTQMKVRRTEIRARRADLLAQVEAKLAQRNAGDDAAVARCRRDIDRVTAKANENLSAMIDKYPELFAEGRWQTPYTFRPPTIYRQQEDKEQIRKALVRQAEAQTAQALLEVDQEEARLLMQLATDALTTDMAREYLRTIPTLDQLLPNQLALEAS